MVSVGDGECTVTPLNDSASRFGASVSGEDVSASARIRDHPRSLNTVRNDTWALKIWKTWAIYRNSLPVTGRERVSEVPVNLKHALESEILFWMPRFIMEVRAGDGKNYSPESLKSILYALFRYLKEECSYAGPPFVGQTSEIGLVLDAKVKELREVSRGMTIRRSDPMSEEDEKTLWDVNVLNLVTSRGILNAVFVYTGKLFGLRNTEQHRLLLREQVLLKTDSAGVRYVEFWPRFVKKRLPQTKTAKHSHEAIKVLETVEELRIRREAVKHYEDLNNPRSYVKLLDAYYKCLKVVRGPFYRRPLSHSVGTSPKFSVSPLGSNNLGQMLRSMFVHAQINIDGRNITTRSLSIGASVRIRNASLEEDFVSKRMGNSNDVRQKSVESATDINKQVSVVLDPQPSKQTQVDSSHANEYADCKETNTSSTAKAGLTNGLRYSLSAENDKMCLHVYADTQVTYSASSSDGGKRVKFCFEVS